MVYKRGTDTRLSKHARQPLINIDQRLVRDLRFTRGDH